MKTVCLDARMLGPCGIGSYLENLLPFFKNASFHLRLIIKPNDAKRIRDWNWIEPIPLDAPIYSAVEQFKLAAIAPPCDLFWSPHYNVPILPIQATKRLVTIHDVFHMAYFSSLSFLQKAYVKVVMKVAIHKSDHVITDSYFSKTELMRFFPVCEEKLQVIPLGINTHSFSSNSAYDEQVISSYQLPNRFILFVGHIRPHKNLLGLLRAFERLCQEDKNLNLVIVGKKDIRKREGLLEQFLLQHPQLTSRVNWIGNIPAQDLAALYRNALAFVFPSFYEGFGLPPLEAMSSGCPVVVSRAASLPEVCGDAAVYVDPHSPSDIADGIARILKDSNLRKLMQDKGKVHAQSFSWTQCAQKHLETIEMLLQ